MNVNVVMVQDLSTGRIRCEVFETPRLCADYAMKYICKHWPAHDLDNRPEENNSLFNLVEAVDAFNSHPQTGEYIAYYGSTPVMTELPIESWIPGNVGDES